MKLSDYLNKYVMKHIHIIYTAYVTPLQTGISHTSYSLLSKRASESFLCRLHWPALCTTSLVTASSISQVSKSLHDFNPRDSERIMAGIIDQGMNLPHVSSRQSLNTNKPPTNLPVEMNQTQVQKRTEDALYSIRNTSYLYWIGTC